jgi:hypothetical protein
MTSDGPFEAPAVRFHPSNQVAVFHLASATQSCSGHDRKDVFDLGKCFAVLQSLGEDAEGKCLRFADGLIARLTVREDAGEIGHFGDPAAVDFLFDFDLVLTRILPRRANETRTVAGQ